MEMEEYGYTGNILRVDLSSQSITIASTLNYADRFIGGRGIAAKIYWDEVSPAINALHPDNRLIFATGPLAGLPALGSSRWQVCGKSLATNQEQFCYANLGGRWGAELKFAGYDALIIQGKSDKPVYLYISDDRVEIREADTLWGKGAIETRETLKSELGTSARVVAIGPAGENMVTMANLLADNDASGSGGLGAVMGYKKLKAIVVKGGKKGINVAQPERLRHITQHLRELWKDTTMSTLFGREFLISGPRTKRDPCYGCAGDCIRIVYESEDGKKGKFMCGAAFFYQPWAERYYSEKNEIPFYATKICNEYGVDALAIDFMVHWLNRCHRAGILSDQSTNIPISRIGSLEFIETLVRKIALREGFGDVLAQGTLKAADSVGHGAREQITSYISKAGLKEMYGPRLYITTSLLHAMEPRPPMPQLHEISFLVGKWGNWIRKIKGSYVSDSVIRAIASRFWGSEAAADFSTYEGKALAAKMIQDREYAKECLILCDWIWPVIDVKASESHIGDPSLESKIYSSVTGKEVDEEGLYHIGERVFNLQRAILLREGHHGRQDDCLPDSWHTSPLKWSDVDPECLVPGKGGEIISRKGSVVDREAFEDMKNEYYLLRQWDAATGLQTRAKLEELNLKDIAVDLEQRGLLVQE